MRDDQFLQGLGDDGFSTEEHPLIDHILNQDRPLEYLTRLERRLKEIKRQIWKRVEDDRLYRGNDFS